MKTMIPEDSEALYDLARKWWLLLIVGIGWLLFAWVVLSFDLTTVWAVAVFAGCGFIFGGVAELFVASQVEGWRWLHIVLGIISILAGIVAFVWPGQTFLVLAAIIAWYLLFNGVFDIVRAFAVREQEDLWWLVLLFGIGQVLIGFWAIGYEGRSVALLVVWVGAAALARGITNLILAFQLRKFRNGPPTAVA